MRFRTFLLSSLLVAFIALCVAFVFGRRARERETVRQDILQRRARLESQIEASVRTLTENQRRQDDFQAVLTRTATRPVSKPAESAAADAVQPNFLKEVL